MDNVNLADFSRLLDTAKEMLAVYGLKAVAAIVILVIGRWIAKRIRNLVESMMTKNGVDPIIVGFVTNITYVALLAFIVIAALGQLGIQTTSFIAILGAAGLAIGLALQGSLANFAAGFLMIIFRPFKVGDYIEGAGVGGSVKEIQIFTTTLTTPDNKVIIIPNAKLSGDNITNYSTQTTRRVELTVGVSYDADVKHVRHVLEEIVRADKRVFPEPEPFIGISELADNSVNFVVRAWTATSDYWGVYFDMTETVKVRFDQEAIGIPYPQRDVHLYEHKSH